MTVSVNGSGAECGFCVISIEEIALHVQHLGIGNEVKINIVGGEQTRCPEKRIHRSFCIGSHNDHATTGRHLVISSTGSEPNPHCPKVVAKGGAKVII